MKRFEGLEIEITSYETKTYTILYGCMLVNRIYSILHVQCKVCTLQTDTNRKIDSINFFLTSSALNMHSNTLFILNTKSFSPSHMLKITVKNCDAGECEHGMNELEIGKICVKVETS